MLDLYEYAKKRYKEPTVYDKSGIKKIRFIKSLIPCVGDVLDLGGGDVPLGERLDTSEVNLQDCDFPYTDETFMTVVASEIIEHILDVDSFLQEIKRVLYRRGTLIVSTPNLASLGRRLMLLCGRNPYVENFLYPNEAGHVKHYTIKDFRYLMNKNGFKITYLTGDCVVFSPNGKLYSVWLARLFPTLSRSMIAVCESL